MERTIMGWEGLDESLWGMDREHDLMAAYSHKTLAAEGQGALRDASRSQLGTTVGGMRRGVLFSGKALLSWASGSHIRAS
jgi:hypothetical protein